LGLRLRLLVFLASFLLFTIELLVGRMVLPAFGSGAQVWATCLVFYQVTLFLGYLYAERANRWIAERRRRWAHLVLALVPLIALPFRIWRVDISPAVGVLLALVASAGLPFFVLSTTSVVAQAWLADSDHPKREDPYFLYGVSNAGALAALVLYPLVLEPTLTLGVQRWGWFALYLGYVVLVALCVPRVGTRSDTLDPSALEHLASTPEPATGRSLRATWLLLPAGANALLMACTNAVTLDAAVPLVWTLPLVAYLLTLVLCFGPTPLSEKVFQSITLVGLAVAAVSTWALASGRSVQGAVLALQLSVLFVGCLLLHRAVARARPLDLSRLGTYYRDLALGGALGGALVGLGAPLLFRHMALPALDDLLALALILPGLLARDSERVFAFVRRRRLLAGAVVLSLLAACVLGALAVRAALRARVESVRTFYGLYTVTDANGRRWFRHGNTFHGVEQLAPESRDEPLAYYHRGSPIARVLALRAKPGRTVGVVGLGVGTLATYARPGESWDFYELDPEVIRIAKEDFHFLEDAEAQVRLIPGDARLTLEGTPDGRYDVLVVDAFNSDFVPIHLITREAVRLYEKKLAPGGVIVCHVSNRLFALAPELARIARAEGMVAAFGTSAPGSAKDVAEGRYDSAWVLLAKDPNRLSRLGQAAGFRALEAEGDTRPWTDDWVNLLRAIR
jgi:SAM-dependent methyltransferase